MQRLASFRLYCDDLQLKLHFLCFVIVLSCGICTSIVWISNSWQLASYFISITRRPDGLHVMQCIGGSVPPDRVILECIIHVCANSC